MKEFLFEHNGEKFYIGDYVSCDIKGKHVDIGVIMVDVIDKIVVLCQDVIQDNYNYATHKISNQFKYNWFIGIVGGDNYYRMVWVDELKNLRHITGSEFSSYVSSFTTATAVGDTTSGNTVVRVNNKKEMIFNYKVLPITGIGSDGWYLVDIWKNSQQYLNNIINNEKCMNKQEVQKRVLQNGTPLDLNKFTWDENTKTFSSSEDSLVLDFRYIDGCTFKTGSRCTFNTGSSCTFKTGSRCTFNIGFGCTFKTGSRCTFKTGSGCTFNTGYDCTFETGSDCTFDTSSVCTFKTGSVCTFDTGSYCTFKTGSDCTFKTGSDCTFDTGYGCTFNTNYGCTFETGSDCTFITGSECDFKTGSRCTFKTGKECVVVRREVYEVIEIKEGVKIKLNSHGEKGFTVIDENKDSLIKKAEELIKKAEELKSEAEKLK